MATSKVIEENLDYKDFHQEGWVGWVKKVGWQDDLKVVREGKTWKLSEEEWKSMMSMMPLKARILMIYFKDGKQEI